MWLLTHVLGDGDDYLFGVTLASGYALSTLVYVDHNLGTVVKDAFVVPEPLQDLALKVGTTIEGPDPWLTRTDAATARAVMQAAIEHGSRLYPPLSSESWPMCRPLVEWMLRQLPSDSVAPEPKEWAEEETAAIAEDFFASPYGAPLDHPHERSLLASVLWFGTGYATGDPFRWSPVTVEMLLADWFPRKIVAEAAYLAKLPDLLRAFIRYCHHRQGIRAALTEQTLSALDHYEPPDQQVIRSARPQGPAAPLAGMFQAHAGEDELGIGEIMVQGLDRKVGGRLQLQNLDEHPLPDEPFEWAGVADDIRPVVQQMLDTCDRCAEQLLDVEHRTAFFAAAPQPGRGRRPRCVRPHGISRPRSRCGGVGDLSRQRHRRRPQVGPDRAGALGLVRPERQRLPTCRATIACERRRPHRLYEAMDLGAPDLLTSKARAGIISSRDRWLGQ